MKGDRLISLNAAIALFEKYGAEEDAIALLNSLPSAQQWIPTSERLPEGICQVIVQTNGGAIHEVFYKGKNDYGHEVWMMVDGGIYWDDEVVAWMPIPDPYKEHDDD